MARSGDGTALKPPLADPATAFGSLLRRQNKNRFFNAEAPYLESREEVVEFIQRLALLLEYHTLTLHSAVALADAVLSLYAVPRDQLNMVAYVCTSMAAKMTEAHDVPVLDEAVRLFEDAFSKDQLRACEETVFRALDFNLNIVTSLHFLEFFLSAGVVPRLAFAGLPDPRACLLRLEGLARDMLDQSLRDYRFYRFTPVTIALAAIEASKRSIGLVGSKTNGLESFTQLPVVLLAECVNLFASAAAQTQAQVNIVGAVVEQTCAQSECEVLTAYSS